MQDLFEKYPNGVIWAKLSLVEKFYLKQTFFNGDRYSSSAQISMNCRAQLKNFGIKKTFTPTYGRKFTITIPTIHSFLGYFVGCSYHLTGIQKKKNSKKPKLIVDTNNFDELLDFCNYFPHFFYRFYLDKHINNMTKTQAIRIMRNHRAIYRVLPDNLKSNKQIAQMALRSENCTLLAFAPPSIINSDLFFQLAVSKYFDALYYFPENIIKKATNRKYIESQMYKVKLNKTLSKLPESLLYKYFDCLPFIECNSYQRLGWRRSKPFSLKFVLKYCSNYTSFNSALEFGNVNSDAGSRILKELEKFDINRMKGDKLLSLIKVICNGYQVDHSHQFDPYKNLLEYFNLILNKFNLVGGRFPIDTPHFYSLNPFQIASFESDLDEDRRVQLNEIKSFITSLNTSNRRNLADDFYTSEGIPF